jgi:type I restriction enzyme S subunit
MIMAMIRPETEMKDSGVQWMGDIPNDWDVRRLKYVLNERKEKNDPLVTDNILSLSAEQGVIPFSERIGGGNKPKEDLTAYKVVRAGDIVLNSMNVLSGAVHYSNYTGCVSPVYYMLYNENDVITRYYNLVFQTEAFQRSLRGLGNGILIKETDEGKLNTIRMRIPMEKLNKVKLPSPSFDEMKKVVESIEPIRSKIDEIIAEAKASVEEYKELRLSVLTSAITKGLSDAAKYKDSGSRWVDKIPSNWSKMKIHYIIDMPVIDGPHVSPELVGEGVDYISANAIVDGKIDFSKRRGYITREYSNECRKRYSPQKNDILVVKLGASTGKMAMVGDYTDFDIWVPIAVVRCKKEVNAKYVYYSMSSKYFKDEIKDGWTFGT